VENAGLKNEGPKCGSGKWKIGICRTKIKRVNRQKKCNVPAITSVAELVSDHTLSRSTITS